MNICSLVTVWTPMTPCDPVHGTIIQTIPSPGSNYWGIHLLLKVSFFLLRNFWICYKMITSFKTRFLRKNTICTELGSRKQNVWCKLLSFYWFSNCDCFIWNSLCGVSDTCAVRSPLWVKYFHHIVFRDLSWDLCTANSCRNCTFPRNLLTADWGLAYSTAQRQWENLSTESVSERPLNYGRTAFKSLFCTDNIRHSSRTQCLCLG